MSPKSSKEKSSFNSLKLLPKLGWANGWCTKRESTGEAGRKGLEAMRHLLHLAALLLSFNFRKKTWRPPWVPQKANHWRRCLSSLSALWRFVLLSCDFMLHWGRQVQTTPCFLHPSLSEPGKIAGAWRKLQNCVLRCWDLDFWCLSLGRADPKHPFRSQVLGGPARVVAVGKALAAKDLWLTSLSRVLRVGLEVCGQTPSTSSTCCETSDGSANIQNS